MTKKEPLLEKKKLCIDYESKKHIVIDVKDLEQSIKEFERRINEFDSSYHECVIKDIIREVFGEVDKK